MEELLSVFKALSDETRLRMLKIMEKGDICVCDLVSVLDVSQPKISFHLNVLKEAGLIKDRKNGKWVHYSIDDSDIFKRFLVLSVMERIPEEAMKKNFSTLSKLLNSKNKDRCGK